MVRPTYFTNPFIESDNSYNAAEVLSNVTANDLQYIMFKDIYIRTHDISKVRIVGADTRFPPLLYESAYGMDKSIKQRYCVRDGVHRLLKMKLEGKISAVCFILQPHAYDNLNNFSFDCNSCQE
tara:strand:- start:59 stop:430 length:372 start_codon:yes stop_codon:yes gene_type:complete